jgi:hypothetical protein
MKICEYAYNMLNIISLWRRITEDTRIYISDSTSKLLWPILSVYQELNDTSIDIVLPYLDKNRKLYLDIGEMYSYYTIEKISKAPAPIILIGIKEAKK